MKYLLSKISRPLNSTRNAALGLSLLIPFLSGCDKPATSKSAATEESSPPAVTSLSAKPAAEFSKTTPTVMAELTPLSPDIEAMVMSNRNASVLVQIADLVAAPINDTEKAQACLLLLPMQNRDGQRLLAQETVRHINNATHVLIKAPLVEGKLDPQILSVFMTDTLKRPDGIKLPTLLALARVEDHPMQKEAMELLVAFTKQNHGTNWPAWQQAMETHLRETPTHGVQ